MEIAYINFLFSHDTVSYITVILNIIFGFRDYDYHLINISCYKL